VDRWIDYVPVTGAPHRAAGRLKVLRAVASPQLGNTRDLLVCLPPSYAASQHRYPVLYMQDGQNLFDRGTSYVEEWRADEVLDAAAAEGVEAILVGIPHMREHRMDEYSPYRDRRLGGGRAADYLAFLIDTVKPLIDAAFRTRPGRAGTGVLGSSMGGLFSVYALFQRSDVFGCAGAMSPALWFSRRAIFRWLERQPPPHGRLYLDAGTEEGPIVLADVARLRDLLIERGYRSGRDLRVVLEAGGRHNETAWSRRLLGALQFLLRNEMREIRPS
jgi:predicted alpha/beta superfamily hydrolase